jgi:hypothetical protein
VPRILLLVGGALAIALVSCFIGSAIGGSATTSRNAASPVVSTVTITETVQVPATPPPTTGVPATTGPPATTAPPPATPPAAAGPTIRDGTWLVGTDIQPGQYRARVPADSSLCYWARLRGTSGTANDSISNGAHQPNTEAFVTIARTDKAFQSEGCGSWTKIG